MLEVVVYVKKRLLDRIRSAAPPWQRVVSVMTLLLVLPGSKFVVLMLARGGVRRVIDAR